MAGCPGRAGEGAAGRPVRRRRRLLKPGAADGIRFAGSLRQNPHRKEVIDVALRPARGYPQHIRRPARTVGCQTESVPGTNSVCSTSGSVGLL